MGKILPITVYPDAERAVIDYLTVPAGYEIDVRGGGGRFVRVRRVGGVELTPRHDQPLIDVLVWADDDLERMTTARSLWAQLRAAHNDPAGAGAVIMYDSTFLGPRQMPDPADITQTVCMFTVQLIVRPADAGP